MDVTPAANVGTTVTTILWDNSPPKAELELRRDFRKSGRGSLLRARRGRFVFATQCKAQPWNLELNVNASAADVAGLCTRLREIGKAIEDAKLPAPVKWDIDSAGLSADVKQKICAISHDR